MGGGSKVVDVFDTESQTWSELEELPAIRSFCNVEFDGNQVLVFGGNDNDGRVLNSILTLNVGDLVAVVPVYRISPMCWNWERKHWKSGWNERQGRKRTFFPRSNRR
mmetsp:Transcript_52/g.123  ORF Transcript_52/g.123 Transcript_52/m.123 type:complete len:107 (+) Transcript_52:139-459(+)